MRRDDGVDRRAVPGEQFGFKVAAKAVAHQGVDQLLPLVGVAPDADFDRRPPDHLVTLPAISSREGVIDVDVLAVSHTRNGHGVRAGQKGGAIEFLAVADFLLQTILLGDVGEDQHDARDLAGEVADRRGAVGDLVFIAVTRQQHGVVSEADDLTALHHELDRIGHRLARIGIDDAEHFRQQVPARVAQRPGGHLFCRWVHARYAALGVGGNHGVADRMQCRRQTFFAFAQARFALLAAADFFLLLLVGDRQLGGARLHLRAQGAQPQVADDAGEQERAEYRQRDLVSAFKALVARRGDPLLAQPLACAVGDHLRQPLVEQRQQFGVAFLHGKAEVVIARKRWPGQFKTGQAQLSDQALGRQRLHDHRVVLACRQLAQSFFDRFGRRDALGQAIGLDILLGAVALHHHDGFILQVGRTPDAPVALAHDDGAVDIQIRRGEIVDRLTLLGSRHQRQDLNAPFGEILFDLVPGTDGKLDFAPHRTQRFAQHLDRETIGPRVFGDDRIRRIVELAGRLDRPTG